jgi:hypothetical protein
VEAQILEIQELELSEAVPANSDTKQAPVGRLFFCGYRSSGAVGSKPSQITSGGDANDGASDDANEPRWSLPWNLAAPWRRRRD